MIELAASIRTLRNAAKSKLQRPTLVHCSAGVGRTGSFLAMIDALDAIHAGQKVDILEIIGRLRNDRCRLVRAALLRAHSDYGVSDSLPLLIHSLFTAAPTHPLVHLFVCR